MVLGNDRSRYISSRTFTENTKVDLTPDNGVGDGDGNGDDGNEEEYEETEEKEKKKRLNMQN